MIHDAAHRLLAAGAALDDLEPYERLAWDANLSGCPDCRRIENDLELVLADLALAAPERLPPPDLMAGIRLAIAAEEHRDRDVTASAAPALAPRPPTGPRGQAAATAPVAAARPGWRPVVVAIGLAAAFAVLAIGLGARSIGLGGDLERSRTEVAALRSELAGQGAAMAAAVDPRHVTATLHAEPLAPAATAVVVFVPGTPAAYLVAHDLPATPAGRAYQLWYADATGVHPLGVSTWNGDGTFVAPLDVDLGHSSAVMVTLEPSGGSKGEPGPQVVFGELGSGT